MAKRVLSKFWRFWPSDSLKPGGLVVMSDRIYIVDPKGSLWRLPIGEAFNVRETAEDRLAKHTVQMHHDVGEY